MVDTNGNGISVDGISIVLISVPQRSIEAAFKLSIPTGMDISIKRNSKLSFTWLKGLSLGQHGTTYPAGPEPPNSGRTSRC